MMGSRSNLLIKSLSCSSLKLRGNKNIVRTVKFVFVISSSGKSLEFINCQTFFSRQRWLCWVCSIIIWSLKYFRKQRWLDSNCCQLASLICDRSNGLSSGMGPKVCFAQDYSGWINEITLICNCSSSCLSWIQNRFSMDGNLMSPKCK